MARYTLKTFCGPKLLEHYQQRNTEKLLAILSHCRFHSTVEYDDYGNIADTPNKFEIYDSHRTLLFSGNIGDTLTFVKTL